MYDRHWNHIGRRRKIIGTTIYAVILTGISATLLTFPTTWATGFGIFVDLLLAVEFIVFFFFPATKEDRSFSPKL